MNASKINSIAALAVAVLSPILGFYQPQLSSFLQHNPVLGVIVTVLIGLWNNLSQPVHKG
jgi:hypothetical protein